MINFTGMKKIITTILAASMMLMGTTAFAQVSIGAGYLNSSSKVTNSSKVLKTPYNGFYAGIGYDINEGAGFGINTGLYFSYILSTKSGSIGSILSGSAKTAETYLDIPVRLNLSTDFGPSLRASLFAGPVFSCGISSNTKASGSIAGIEIGTGDIDNYADSDYNRFDIQLGGGVNIDMSQRIRLTASYDLGMLNRIKTDSDDYKCSRNVLRVGLAFLF